MTKRQADQLNAYLTSLSRTVVPFVVGWIVTHSLKWAGVDLSGYTQILEAGVGFGYFALINYAERFIDPRAGWLLGIAKLPHYTTKPSPHYTPKAGK